MSLKHSISNFTARYNMPRILLLAALILIIVAMMIFFFGKSSSTTYIAIGDSVASGYGLPLNDKDIPEGRYTALFFEKLKKDGHVKKYHNMAHNGYTTTDVLEMLENLSAKELKLFNKAKVVTVNIGGNNILMPYLAYLSDLKVATGSGQISSGAGNIASGGREVWDETVYGVRSVFTDTLETKIDLKRIGSSLRNMASGLSEIFKGTWETVSGVPSAVTALSGTLTPELEDKLNQGVQIFYDEFADIIAWIETNAPNATIIVNTVFNPIPQEILKISVPMSEWVENLVGTINIKIHETSKINGFLVADIHSHLSNNIKLMSFNLNSFAESLSLDFVHPNAEGHKLIAEINYAIFTNEIIK